MRNSESKSMFKKSLLKFTRTIPNSVFSVADIYGIKLLRSLRAGLNIDLDITFKILLIRCALVV